MARGRMINKKISTSKRVNNLPADAALLYTWLLAHVDVNGVFYADPNLVKSIVIPRRPVIAEQVEAWLHLMAEAKKDDETPLIHVFQSDGDDYLWCPGFEDEQIGLYWKSEKPEHPLPPRELYERYGFTLLPVIHKDGEETKHIRKYTGRQQVSGPGDNDPKLAQMVLSYEENIGVLTPMLVDELEIIAKDAQIPEGWFAEAVKEAVSQNKRTLKYVNGILKRWVRDGKGVKDGADRQHATEEDSHRRTARLKQSVRSD